MSVVSFAFIFSNSQGWLFTSFIVSFTVERISSLIRSHLFTFVFILIPLGGGSERILLWFMPSSVILLELYPMLSSKSFIVSGLTFRPLIHFDFIFVCSIRKYLNLILLPVAVPFSQHHLLKRLSFPYCIFLPPLSKIRYP